MLNFILMITKARIMEDMAVMAMAKKWKTPIAKEI